MLETHLDQTTSVLHVRPAGQRDAAATWIGTTTPD